MALRDIIQPFFVGDGGRRLTPEQVAEMNRRAQQSWDQGNPAFQNAGWLGVLGSGLEGLHSTVLRRRAERADEAGREGARSAIEGNPVLSALMGGQPVGGASPAVVSPAVAPAGASAEAIRAGLIARGMPEHVADGFVMNFQDESGLNPGINEVSPLVPGSRGGFGLAQWTGPRRVALERFAQERGTSPADVDTQLDFLMTELQGPEARAAQAIFAAPDSASAADAVLRSFLRPAAEHVDTRSARYLGGQPGSSFAAPNQNVVSALMAAQSDPWVQELYGPSIDALIGQQMNMQNAAYQQSLNQADPMYQAQLGLAQAQLDAALNPVAADPTAERAAFAAAGGLEPGSPEWNHYMLSGEMMPPQGATYTYEGGQWWRHDPGGLPPVAVSDREVPPTTAIQNAEYLMDRGLTEEDAFERAFSGSSVNVNVGGDGQRLGTVPPGYTVVEDPSNPSGFRMEMIPGGPVAQEASAAAAQADIRAEQLGRASGVVLEDIGRVRDMIESDSFPVAGMSGSLLANVPGTPAHDAQNLLGTIRANIGFDRLQQMREGSPTGGALGTISDRELGTLQAVMGSIEQSQSPEQLLYNLNRLETIYQDIMRKAAAYPNASDFGFGAEDGDSGSSGDGPQRLRFDPVTGTFQ